MNAILFSTILLFLTSCFAPEKTNLSTLRTPSSDEIDCGAPYARTFNGRRLLALNSVIKAHKKRLEGYAQTAEVLAQIQSLDNIWKKTTYPGVEAIWPYEKVSELLKVETDAVLVILKRDKSKNKQVDENIKYLEDEFKPNITNVQHWCSDLQQRAANPKSSPSKDGTR